LHPIGSNAENAERQTRSDIDKLRQIAVPELRLLYAILAAKSASLKIPLESRLNVALLTLVENPDSLVEAIHGAWRSGSVPNLLFMFWEGTRSTPAQNINNKSSALPLVATQAQSAVDQS
jgi:hypothetical protein